MLTFVPANAQHIGRRNEQQDSFAFSDPNDRTFTAHGGLVGVVADGMGGLAAGAEASRRAVKSFLSAYCEKAQKEPISAALMRSLRTANEAVLGLSQNVDDRDGAGTTLAAIVMRDSFLHWISVGDSRMYLLRKGQLARINADHNRRTSLLREIASEHLDREAAAGDPEAAYLTSFLGLPEIPFADVSVRPFPLMQDDIVFVCTDGVYRSLSEREIIDALQSRPFSIACETLQATTLGKAQAAQDNLTIIAVQCRADLRPTGAFRVRDLSRTSILTSVVCAELLLAAGLAGSMIWRAYHHEGTARQRQSNDATGKELSPGNPKAPSTNKTPAVGPMPLPEANRKPKD